MTTQGKTQTRTAEALALTVAAELNSIADTLVMSTREVFDTEYILRAVDTSLEELASLSEYYSKQSLRVKIGVMFSVQRDR